MCLRFGRARADGVSTRLRVAKVLRRNWIRALRFQQADRVRQSSGGIHGPFSCPWSTWKESSRSVVVDIAFPARRRARFFEIHAHDDAQRVADVVVGQLLQAARVVHAGDRIVDRARADDDEQSVVLVRSRMLRTASRPCMTVPVAFSESGSQACISSGEGMASEIRHIDVFDVGRVDVGLVRVVVMVSAALSDP